MLADQMLVATALDVLPAPRRDTLDLASSEGPTQPEIAARLDLPLGTVTSHQRRGPDRVTTWSPTMPPADRPDTDELVVRAALGEPLSDEEQALIDGDDHLRAEVASFREVVDLARSAPEEVAASSTLEHLWKGIAEEAFGDRQAAGDPPPPPGSNVVRLPRSTLWAGIGAVAAVAATVVALVTVGPLASDDAPRPVASADLEPFGGAEVEPVEAQFVDAAGTRELRLDLSALPPPEGAFYEVWLLDPDEGRLVSLGPARPDGTYVLPDGAAPADWPAVDVSVESHDGDPGHSGDSVLRGPVRIA